MNSQFQSTQHHPFKDLENNTIGYCTDVEGNYEYWKRYLRLSKVLERTETGGVRLKSDCHFVYGGDVCDRGYGDLRILKDLVQLKSENPDRVHLILGNRDINKLRLLTELQPESYSQPGETYWTGPLKQTDDFTMTNRLKAILNQTMGAPAAFEYRRRELLDIAAAAASPQDQKTDVTDEEVAQSFMDSIGPDGLLTKYLSGGTLAVLLGDCLFFHGGLHDNTIGYVPPLLEEIRSSSESKSPPTMPPLPLLRWIEALERFKSTEMEDYRFFSSLLFASCPAPPLSSIQRVSQGKDGRERFYGSEVWARVGGYQYPAAGGRLLQYGMGWLPDKSVNPTLIYDNYLNEGAPSPPPPSVRSYLLEAGVRRVITGHQPHGDAVVVMAIDSLQFLTGDTSYAKDTKWSCPPQIAEEKREEYVASQVSLGQDILSHIARQATVSLKEERDLIAAESLEGLSLFSTMASPANDPSDTRGIAVSEIYFTFGSLSSTSPSSSGFVHGVLSNGIPYHFPLAPVDQRSSNLVGLATTDGWWIKGKLAHSGSAAEPSSQQPQLPPDSIWRTLSSLVCLCRQQNRPITPQDEPRSPGSCGESEEDDESIYLVCYSRGRDVYNGFARGKELKSRGLAS